MGSHEGVARRIAKWEPGKNGKLAVVCIRLIVTEEKTKMANLRFFQ